MSLDILILYKVELRSCFKIIKLDFSMGYVCYKVPIFRVTLGDQTPITPGSGEVIAPIQTGSGALHMLS